jgi:hypothetical protein
MYYGSYRAPRTLVWAIGTVILILMIGTGFLGYQYSPKWYNNNNNMIYISTIYNNNNKVRYYSTISGINFSKNIYEFLVNKNLTPVLVFEDLRSEYTKGNIKDKTKGLSGIYLIWSLRIKRLMIFI